MCCTCRYQTKFYRQENPARGQRPCRERPAANALQNQGAQVDVAADANEARSLWRPNTYDLILVDVQKQTPGEVLDFCRRIKGFYPQQRIAFLVGPPRYLSVKWPEQVSEASTADQWEETVKWLVTAA